MQVKHGWARSSLYVHPAFISGLYSLSLFLIFAPTSHAQIPTSGLVAKYDFSGNANNSAPGNAPNGDVNGASLAPDRFGIANRAYAFNGTTNYIEIADSDVFSIPTTGSLSISVWVSPVGTSLDSNGQLLFSRKEGDGYVHWMGKGFPGQHEWTFRIYSADNTADPYRANRMSYYLFNPIEVDGVGPGSYVQEPVVPGEWIHYVAVVKTDDKTITWYKNGVQRDRDFFDESQGQFHVNPVNGTATVRIGTRNRVSYFAGAIDDIRVYNRALSLAEIGQLYRENGLPGDFNQDGSIDAADYVVWRDQGGTPEAYEIWRANFGEIATGGASHTLVPEPTTLLLMIGAAISLLMLRRRCS